MTTRRTIRILVTDIDDSETDRFGCSNQERASLLREFAVDPVLDKSPADLVGALAEWLDGQPRRSQHCDFQLVDHLGPPRACVLPPGHKGEHYGIGGDQQCDEYITSDRRCNQRLGHIGLHEEES